MINRKRWLTKFGVSLVTLVLLARIITIYYYTIIVRYTSGYRVLISDKPITISGNEQLAIKHDIMHASYATADLEGRGRGDLSPDTQFSRCTFKRQQIIFNIFKIIIIREVNTIRRIVIFSPGVAIPSSASDCMMNGLNKQTLLSSRFVVSFPPFFNLTTKESF